MGLLNAIRQRFHPRLRREAERQRRWPALMNLETSYACNLRCRMCPRGAGDGAAGGLLEPPVFERLLPSAHRFKYVHLTGWGEPLLNPRLPEYARRLKEAGCHVSFTSNGTLLTPDLTRELLAVGVNAINVSCDAGTAAAYESVRGKGMFDRLVDNLQALCALRVPGQPFPYVQWGFILMKSNLEELANAVALAGECGVDRFVAKHLETALDDEGLADACFDTRRVPPPSADEQRRFEATLAEARAVAARYPSLQFEAHPQLDPDETTCAGDPRNAVFVDHTGAVCPCCYAAPMDTRPFQSERSPSEKTLVLGNVMESSLEDLLASPAYQAFLNAFASGAIPPVCRGCLLLARRPASDDRRRPPSTTR